MNIDFIKWMADYAEGFKLFENPDLKDPYIKTSDGEYWNTKTLKDYSTREGIFLQRTIEGINKSDSEWTIWTNQYLKKIYANWKDGNNTRSQKYPIGENIDEAKTATLKYIYEQETQ